MVLNFVIISLMECRAKENVESEYYFLFLSFGKRPAYLAASRGMSRLGWNWMEWPLTVFQITSGKSNFWRKTVCKGQLWYFTQYLRFKPWEPGICRNSIQEIMKSQRNEKPASVTEDKLSGLLKHKIKDEDGSVSNKILNYFIFFTS